MSAMKDQNMIGLENPNANCICMVHNKTWRGVAAELEQMMLYRETATI